MFVQSFGKYSNNWLRRTNIKSNLTPEIEWTLKLSIYDAKPWCLHFTAKKFQYPSRFSETDPEMLHTCLMCPCRAFYELGFSCFVFLAGNVGSLQTQISHTRYNTKPTYLAKKKIIIRKNIRQGHIKHVCKILGSYLSKTAWGLGIGLWRDSGFTFEPACIKKQKRRGWAYMRAMKDSLQPFNMKSLGSNPEVVHRAHDFCPCFLDPKLFYTCGIIVGQ